jgi:phosphotriesterase-related protein
MSTRIVRTVSGDVDPEALGPCDSHEHVFLATPALPGEELEDPALAFAEARALREAGAAALVDWTPIGLGRQPVQLAALARLTELHIVASSGFHQEIHYRRGHWVWREPADVLSQLVVQDVMVGMDGRDWQGPRELPTETRAGAIKLGAGLHRITALERKLFEAGAAAAQTTGAPVLVHCEQGTHAAEVLDALASLGVESSRVVLAHLDRNPDPGLHADLAARGCHLAYDRAGRVGLGTDSDLIRLIATVAERGHLRSLLLGGDTARRSSLRAAGGGPGLDHAFRSFLPRVREQLGEEVVRALTVENPARAFSFEPRA